MWRGLKEIHSGFMEDCLEGLLLEQLVISILFPLKNMMSHSGKRILCLPGDRLKRKVKPLDKGQVIPNILLTYSKVSWN